MTTSNRMATAYARQLQAECRAELLARTSDFGTQFIAMHHLQRVILEQPGLFEDDSLRAIHQVLTSGRFARQRQGLFFYRQAAEILRDVILQAPEGTLALRAFEALRQVLGAVSGHGHRAAAEALGGLPVVVRGPAVPEPALNGVPSASWEQVLRAAGLRANRPPARYGRSLAVPAAHGGMLVVKLARCDQPPHELLQEALWLSHLRRQDFGYRLFRIPLPIALDNHYLFRITSAPMPLSRQLHLSQGRYAIGFMAARHYFRYPNMPGEAARLSAKAFAGVMARSARLFGRLASLGIIHEAPIPLFHNRVQVHRRRDAGRYEWYRGGRLDRWLESCDYPNFGAGGLRDFEHLVSFHGDSLQLYRCIGMQLLSLLLVAGSYFRNREPRLAGRSAGGEAVDARHLFCPELVRNVIERIFADYHLGFAGTRIAAEDMPLDLDRLAARMIDEMGVDRHMEEVLRTADQDEMTEADFRQFLKDRGYRDDALRQLKKGQEDLVVLTGPHLGGFNQRISLPELIEAIETMSALCLADRYFQLSHKSN